MLYVVRKNTLYSFLLMFIGLVSHVKIVLSNSNIPAIRPILSMPTKVSCQDSLTEVPSLLSPRKVPFQDSPATKSRALCLIKYGLQSSNPLKRRFGAWELGEMGNVASDAVPFLINSLKKDSGKWERLHSVLALGKIGVPVPKVLSGLRLALEDSDQDVRSHAATIMGELVVKLQNKFEVNDVSQHELRVIVSELSAALKILRAPTAIFHDEPIARITSALEAFKKYAK
jgi:HEAT repeats